MKDYLVLYSELTRDEVELIGKKAILNIKETMKSFKQRMVPGLINAIEMGILYGMGLIIISEKEIDAAQFKFVKKNVYQLSELLVFESIESLTEFISNEDIKSLMNFVLLNSQAELFDLWNWINQNEDQFKKFALNYFVLLSVIAYLGKGVALGNVAMSILDTIEQGFKHSFDTVFTKDDFIRIAKTADIKKYKNDKVNESNFQFVQETVYERQEYETSFDIEPRELIYDFSKISNQVSRASEGLELNQREIIFIQKLNTISDDIDLLNLTYSIYANANPKIKESVTHLLNHIYDANDNHRSGFDDIEESISNWLNSEDRDNLVDETIAIWALLLIMTAYDTPFDPKVRSKYSAYDQLYFHNYFEPDFVKKSAKNYKLSKIALAIDGTFIGTCQKYHYGHPELIDIAVNNNVLSAQLVNKTFLEKTPDITNQLNTTTVNLIKSHYKNAGKGFKQSPLVEYLMNN